MIEFQRVVVPVVRRGVVYGYPPQIDFRSWSEIADRGRVVSVLESGDVVGQGEIAQIWAVPDWGLTIRPWNDDDCWPDLVRNSWYRAGRSLTGYGVLTYDSGWSMCYVSAPERRRRSARQALGVLCQTVLSASVYGKGAWKLTPPGGWRSSIGASSQTLPARRSTPRRASRPPRSFASAWRGTGRRLVASMMPDIRPLACTRRGAFA